ncbi:guanylate kinase [Tistlia consotensis]|uniref:Guanylate kinase n=2 Tax=Tistlia TaxID=1321364 RepID=A0A1Y6CWC0_9PROT|nr:guanylate kinase [Tistlia consotensis USBA 355]SNS32804.1 guanylate kinase [Tistlia consotensis]
MARRTARFRRRGLMFVLSSPSGAGKTTISRKLLEDDDNLQLSISATTRPKRPGERDGIDYHFVDHAAFERMAQGGELLEHAVVFGNRYGTPRGPVEKALAAGRDVLFDIDWQGTQQVYSKMPDDVVRVFILPPSIEELERRLHTRAQDSDEVVAQRMAKAADEMSHYDAYDYIIVNEQVERAVVEAKAILTAERRRLKRLIGLDSFVKQLRGEG